MRHGSGEGDGAVPDDDLVSTLRGIVGPAVSLEACAAMLARNGGDVAAAVNNHFAAHDPRTGGGGPSVAGGRQLNATRPVSGVEVGLNPTTGGRGVGVGGGGEGGGGGGGGARTGDEASGGEGGGTTTSTSVNVKKRVTPGGGTPRSPDSESQTRDTPYPKPWTMNPKPGTLNTKPYT
jgi:hypothetical protein